MIRVEEHDNVRPVCPHCNQPLDRLTRTPIQVTLGKAFAWSCPYCRKVLGVTHRKGFWMG